jgi:hypothetical protein
VPVLLLLLAARLGDNEPKLLVPSAINYALTSAPGTIISISLQLINPAWGLENPQPDRLKGADTEGKRAEILKSLLSTFLII